MDGNITVYDNLIGASNGDGFGFVLFIIIFFVLAFTVAKVSEHMETRRYNEYIKKTRGGNENE
jgi:uncharacterized membrane protein YkvI